MKYDNGNYTKDLNARGMVIDLILVVIFIALVVYFKPIAEFLITRFGG
jgi:hypothetical protein